MGELAAGMLVQHSSLGVGRVVAVEPTAVHVFFPARDHRFAAKFRWPGARPLFAVDGVAPDEWLAGLSGFALDEESGRYALASGFVTHDEAIADFLAANPRGLAGHARATAWRAASAEWARLCGAGACAQLVADGGARELVRRAQRVVAPLAAVPGAISQPELAGAFHDPQPTLALFGAVGETTSVPSPARARFDALFAAVDALDLEPDLAWRIATLFPFLAAPGRQAFLAPRTARAAAERLGCDLRFDPAPNWTTYAAFRTFCTRLLAPLQAHAARDLVDVEVFLHANATPRAGQPGRGRRPPRRKR